MQLISGLRRRKWHQLLHNILTFITTRSYIIAIFNISHLILFQQTIYSQNKNLFEFSDKKYNCAVPLSPPLADKIYNRAACGGQSMIVM